MTSNAPRSRSIRKHPGVAAVALAATAVLLAGCGSSDDASDPLKEDKGSGSGDTVVVGSNNFAESILLADIYGEALKAKGIKVTYKPNIGSRETTYGLLKNGSITVLPEYNGSLLSYLDPKAEQKSADAVNAAVKTKLDSTLTLLESSPAEDKDSVSVNAETAKKYNLTAESTLADLKDAAPELVIGGSPVPGLLFFADCPIDDARAATDKESQWMRRRASGSVAWRSNSKHIHVRQEET